MSLTTRWAAIVGVVIVEKRDALGSHALSSPPPSRLPHKSALLPRQRSPFFLFVNITLSCLVHLPLLPVKNMTAIIDRAADRIRDDDLLADKKRVTIYFLHHTPPLILPT